MNKSTNQPLNELASAFSSWMDKEEVFRAFIKYN